jgi:hypothetical protein
VGGRNLVAAEVVAVNFAGPTTNPRITVRVQRTDLPTFFARIWGSKQITVAASATAEAYNPSGANALGLVPVPPVAPTCVKPWLLPNIDPTSPPAAPTAIFDTTTGAIAPTATALLGYTTLPLLTTKRLRRRCVNCSGVPLPLPPPAAWRYYPGNPASFPSPTQALPTCAPALTTAYEASIAGCIQTPIACNSSVLIDDSNYIARDTETANAVNCLTHATAGKGDTVDAPSPPAAPFEFIAGADNPVAAVDPAFVGKEMMVSDSLVTVPVYDVGPLGPPGPPPYPAPPLPPGTVTIVGFVQLFLNPDGTATPNIGGDNGRVNTTVINLAGCGIGAAGQPIFGNGASPVAVRLISPP